MRDTAVVLRKKQAVARHEIYKYAVVHTSNRNKSFNAQANAKHLMKFKKWFDVPVLEAELTRMPNLKQALKG